MDVISLHIDDRHLVSTPLTPGFFTLGSSMDEAIRLYRQALQEIGPMPMLPTRFDPSGQEARQPQAGNLNAKYVGFPLDANYGDRWMYHILETRLPELTFTHPENTQDLWNRALPRGHFDLTLVGGGTLINQQPQLYQDVLCSLYADIPCVCFGTGVGNEDRWGDHLAAWVELLSHFQFVGVRGPHSHRRLALAGLAGHHIVGDPCLLDTPSFGPDVGMEEKIRLWVDVSYGAQEDAESTAFRFRLLKCLEDLEGSEVVDLTFFTTWEIYRPWIERQLSSCLSRPHQIVTLNESSRRALSKGDLCIAYRLHASAAALMAGVPTIIINYEEKCTDFALFLGLDKWVLEPNRAGAERIAEMLSTGMRDLIRNETPAVRQAVLDAKGTTEGYFAEFKTAADRACQEKPASAARRQGYTQVSRSNPS